MKTKDNIILIALILITLVLTVLKINNVINWSWLIILCPIYVPLIILLLIATWFGIIILIDIWK